MKTPVAYDYRDMSKMAAKMVADAIRARPSLVLGLATGSTPLGMYKELIRMHIEEGLDFRRLQPLIWTSFTGYHPTTSTATAITCIITFNHVNVKPENIYIPDGKAEDIEEFCREYDRRIEELGPIDLQILGIGRNGHIGFNEPADRLKVDTHVVTLAEETIQATASFFR